MKNRLAVAVLIAACVAGVLPAQPIPWDNSQLFERLGLTEQQTSSIQEILRREDRVSREAQAELGVYKAQLEKLLLGPDPDMRQVERLLQSSMEWKLKSEMAEIRRRVEIRKVLGEQKWQQLVRAWRAWRLRNNARERAPKDRRQPRSAQPRPLPPPR